MVEAGFPPRKHCLHRGKLVFAWGKAVLTSLIVARATQNAVWATQNGVWAIQNAAWATQNALGHTECRLGYTKLF